MLCETCEGMLCDACRRQSSDSPLRNPENVSLPFFAYGALKPGMPGYHLLRALVAEPPKPALIAGHLLVRDGLPLLRADLGGDHHVEGFLLRWRPEKAHDAYSVIGSFEPKEHYQWCEGTIEGEGSCNVLSIRRPEDGNPEPLEDIGGFPATRWRLIDDPAFGSGMDAVAKEMDRLAANRGDWPSFFRCQMAYLLLWSIVERLSALCVGPAIAPMRRITEFAKLEGIAEAVRTNVSRQHAVHDSRYPRRTYRLDPSDPAGTFKYYYQVRSNLSHRGKAVRKDFDLVFCALKELQAITRTFLRFIEESHVDV